jgi:hypothetical protein
MAVLPSTKLRPYLYINILDLLLNRNIVVLTQGHISKNKFFLSVDVEVRIVYT